MWILGAQYYLKSLAHQESPVTNVNTKHRTYWRRDPRMSQMASSSPKMKNPSDVPHPKNLLGKSLPRNSLISHGKDMLIASPPHTKKRRMKSIQVPPPQKRYTTYEKKNMYIYNIPSIIFEGTHFEFASSVLRSKKKSRFPPIIPSPHLENDFLMVASFGPLCQLMDPRCFVRS